MTSDYAEHAEVPLTPLAERMAATERVLLAIRRDGGTIEDIHRAIVTGSDGGIPMPDVKLGTVATAFKSALRRRAGEVTESREEAKELQLLQLDQIIRVHTPKMKEGNAKSADILMRAIADKAKLQGTNAAQEVEHTVNQSVLVQLFGDPAEIEAERQAQIAAGFRHEVIEGHATPKRIAG